METTATDDKTCETSYYSLDVPSFLWDSASSPATPNSCMLSLFMQTPGSWGLTGVVTEITGEEGGVTEVVVPGKLFERLAGTGKFLLKFEDNVVVHKRLGAVAGNAFGYDIQIFGCDVQLAGIPFHITEMLVIHLNQLHERIENITFPLGR